MKIATAELLVERLESEKSWRIVEISQLILHAEKQKDGPLRDAMLRATHALIYAHFEGYTKEALYLYLSHVTTTGTPIHQLDSAIAPFFVRSFRFERVNSGYDLNAGDFVSTVRGEVSSTRRLSVRKDDVDTQSNLNWKRLTRLLRAAGIPVDLLPDREVIIDEHLLARRNTIAHGERDSVTMGDIIDVKDNTLQIIEAVTSLIVNCAISRSYLRRDS